MWSRRNVSKEEQAFVVACRQKSDKEAASLTPAIVKAGHVQAHVPSSCQWHSAEVQLDELAGILSELGLADADGNALFPERIFCCDETGSPIACCCPLF